MNRKPRHVRATLINYVTDWLFEGVAWLAITIFGGFTVYVLI